MRSFVAFILFLFFIPHAQAIEFWTTPVNVKKIGALYTGGNNFLRIYTEAPFTQENGSAVPNCLLTANENMVGNYTSSSFSNTHHVWFASALNAKNTGEKVKLYLSSTCGGKYGLKLLGIEVQ